MSWHENKGFTMLIHDIHCHILPGLDDGAFFIDESLQMARMASSHRSGSIVCTPHALPNSSYSRQTLLDVFKQTYAALRNNRINLKLTLGQEIFLDEDYRKTISSLESGELFTINHSVYPLVEFDPYEDIDSVYRMIDELTSRGFIPVIAHPERYEFTVEDYRALNHMKSMGALLQINKGSLFGYFGPSAKQISMYLLEKRMADFIASDSHSPYRRTPSLREAHELVSEYYSNDYADYLFSSNPLRVLKNEKIYQY